MEFVLAIGAAAIALVVIAVMASRRNKSRSFTRHDSTPPPLSIPPYSGGFDAGPTLLGNLNTDWDIWYEDRNGRTTKRRITVRSLHGRKYPKYVRAWCHGRRDWRHFNVYNIRAAVDVDTGEKVPVTRHLIDWIDTR